MSKKTIEDNLEVAKERLKLLEETIKTLEKQLGECPEWEKGDRYWYIAEDGFAIESVFDYASDEELAFGNMFHSEEEANDMVKKIAAFNRLRKNGFEFEGIKEDYTRHPLYPESCSRCGKRYLQFTHSEDEKWLKENMEDLKTVFNF